MPKKKIVKLKLIAGPNPTYLPGSKFSLGIKAFTQGHNEETFYVYNTDGLLKGKIKWDNYKIEVIGGSFSNGEITIANDSLNNFHHKLTIKATSIADTTIKNYVIVTVMLKDDYYPILKPKTENGSKN